MNNNLRSYRPLLALVVGVLALVAAFGRVTELLASVTLTNSDPAAIRAAIEEGGTVRLGFDGVFPITRAFLITTNTIVDASGHSITFDAGQVDRHFTVTNSASLRLVNLGLVNGRVVGAAGTYGFSGQIGPGGAIYSSGGALDLVGCRLMNNQAIGGEGGLSTNGFFVVGGAGAGGAIYIDSGGALKLMNCNLMNNEAVGGRGGSSENWFTAGGLGAGGAVYVADGDAFMTNCAFSGNSCQGGLRGLFKDASGGAAVGGALYSTNSTLDLLGVSLSSNQAQKGNGSAGGALGVLGGAVVMSNCVFSGNQAVGGTSSQFSAAGGAFFNQDARTTIVERTIFTNNLALGGGGGVATPVSIAFGSAHGGAIYQTTPESPELHYEFRNSAFVHNQAIGESVTNCCNFPFAYASSALGGAIESAAHMAFINCTFAENGAVAGNIVDQGVLQGPPGGASGAALQGNSYSFVNVTLARNFLEPPGLATGGATIDAVVWATNTIFSCGPDQWNIYSGPNGTFDGGHNISSDDSGHFKSESSRQNLDPLLGPLGNYGGPTPTVPLLPGSPAIDAGDDSACPPTDQRGVSRPKGLACDIGAFELAPSLALLPGEQSNVRVEYAFQANRTNQVSVSTNLVGWESLGIRVADTNGTFEIEQVDPIQFPERFYKVIDIQQGQR